VDYNLLAVTIPPVHDIFVKVSENVKIQRSWDRDQQAVGNKDHNNTDNYWILRTSEEGIKKYVDEIPGNINIYKVQKITLLGTVHILRRVLLIN
jgi:hypothetical protein